VRPHLGTAGVAPDEKGRVSTIPPGLHGGNIDNWRIGAGATMYYRVMVDGALFSIGEPHISQGDGELSGTAIEASLNVLFPGFCAQGFQLPVATAGNAVGMDRSRIRRRLECGDAKGLGRYAVACERNARHFAP
jgi:acetamidase/formamidase